MWWPIVVLPAAIPAGIAAVFSRRAARTVLPLASAAIVANGLQGTYLHWRGIAQRPGGITRYNMEAGPPAFAPLLASLVGGMGLLAVAAAPGGVQHAGERLMPYRSPSQRGRTPQGRGRFPGFDVLDSVEQWDDVTAGVVLARLAPPADYAFFTPAEVGIAGPLLDLLLAQDGEPRIPVLALIDARLAVGETDGWHYDELPEDAQAWRQSLAALDDDARTAHSGRSLRPPDRHRAGRAGAAGAGSGRPTASAGTAGRPSTSGACGPATPAPRSTPIPGRGTRSAFPGRPIRAATSTRGGRPRAVGGRRPPLDRPGAVRRPGRAGPRRARPAAGQGEPTARAS